MRVAVASGKGGTGKTTVAVALALSLSRGGLKAHLVDCDVEEPNAGEFLPVKIASSRRVEVMVPEVDRALCDNCGACSAFCRFNAVVVFPEKVMLFPELCHSCKGCMIACPNGAIREARREVGSVETGAAGELSFSRGILDIGETRATPIISALIDELSDSGDVVLDAPPGTSCPYVETVSLSDAAILVTEPTPFGLYDLGMAVEAIRRLGKPFGVVINKDGIGDDGVERYCAEEGIEILMKIPHDRAIAEAISRGEPIVDLRPEIAGDMVTLFERLRGLVEDER